MKRETDTEKAKGQSFPLLLCVGAFLSPPPHSKRAGIGMCCGDEFTTPTIAIPWQVTLCRLYKSLCPFMPFWSLEGLILPLYKSPFPDHLRTTGE